MTKNGYQGVLVLSWATIARVTTRVQRASIGQRLSVAAFALAFFLAVLGYITRPLSLDAQGRSERLTAQGISSVFLPDGGLLVTGGETSTGPIAEAFIIAADGAATPIATMLAARSDHASVVLADGRILVAGGNGDTGVLDSAEIYDPATNAWASVASMTEARAGLTATLLAGGRVLVAGGGSLDVFDPQAGEFSRAGALSPPRSEHAAALMLDGQVLLTGGISSGSAIMFADIYDPASGEISHVPSPLSTARYGHSATTLGDGRVMIAGGSNGTADLSSVELFDPAAQHFFSSSSSLQTPRADQIAQVLPNGTQVMMVGGRSGWNPVTTVELLTAEVNPKAASTISASPTTSQSLLTTDRVALAASAKPSADIDQCRNGGLGATPVACKDVAWVNGNAGASNAHWQEGDSIAYRIKFDGLSAGTHNVVIEWDTTQNGKHSIDYLTTWDRTVNDPNRQPPTPGADQSATDSDACTDVLSAAVCGSPDTEPIPLDPNVSGAGVTQVGGQVFTLYGGTITSPPSAYTLSSSYAGSSSTRITITFTTTAAVPNPILAWGGHIATRLDWGIGSSAIAISGSPYHTRLISIDGGGGNQDRSLSSEAVVFPASITVIKNASPDDAQDFSFSTTGGLTPANFTLDDDSDATNSNTQLFSKILVTTNTGNTYTVTETPATGWALGNPIVCSVTSPNGGSRSQISNGVQINLREGEDVTCTFVNTRQTGTIEVKKVLSPTNDPGKFNLFIKNSTGTVTIDSESDAGHNGTTGANSVAIGTYQVSETAGTGTSLSNYTSSISCSNGASSNSAGPLNVDVTNGATILCTITNTRTAGSIEVKKVLSPSGDSGRFNLFIKDSTGTVTIDSESQVGNNGTTGPNAVNTGTYQVSETAFTGTILSNYTSSISCSNGASTNGAGPLNVDVTSGATILCTITNTRNTGTIEVIKKIDPNPAGGQFNLFVDGEQKATNVGNNGTTNAVTVNTGSHTVNETAGGNQTNLAQYTTAIVCKLNNTTVASGTATSLANIPVGTGDAVVCTITNTYVKASPDGTTILNFVFRDTLTITGLRTGAQNEASAVVNFRVYGASNCDQASFITQDLNRPIVGGVSSTSSGGIAIDNTTLGASKTFWVRAEYTGDDFNGSFSTDCTEEKFQITVRDNFGTPARDGFGGTP